MNEKDGFVQHTHTAEQGWSVPPAAQGIPTIDTWRTLPSLKRNVFFFFFFFGGGGGSEGEACWNPGVMSITALMQPKGLRVEDSSSSSSSAATNESDRLAVKACFPAGCLG